MSVLTIKKLKQAVARAENSGNRFADLNDVPVVVQTEDGKFLSAYSISWDVSVGFIIEVEEYHG